MVHSTVAVTLLIFYAATLQVLAKIPPDPECNVQKGCSYFDCPDSNDCNVLVSWVNSGDSVSFTMKGYSEYENLWFALGFSDNHFMGNDSVTGCKYQDGNTEVFNAMNNKRIDPNILANEGVSIVSSSFKDSTFECTFNRLIAAGVGIVRFDLNQPWYLLFARGPLESNQITYHGPDHAFPSDEKYLTQFEPKPSAVTTPEPTQAPTSVTTPGSTKPAEVTTPSPTGPVPVTTPTPFVKKLKAPCKGKNAQCKKKKTRRWKHEEMN